MSENKKVLFIVNKFAGTGYRSSVEGHLLAYCERNHIEPFIEYTQERGHATHLAREAARSQKFERVMAVGGDGTVNEVAQGVVNTTQRMGILPKGSGNGLARHLCIPMDFKKALQLILSDHTIRMDTLNINGLISVNVSGIGFDGHIANLFGKQGRRGLMGYGKLVIREFFRHSEMEVAAQIDETDLHKKVFILAIANASQFGNNARIAPLASVSDGMIDFCFIKKVPLVNLFSFTKKLFSGQIEHSEFAEIIRGRKAMITFAHPVPYHIDGEGMNQARSFEIVIQPASLSMIAPSHLHARL
jgi:diacylglycerol kinase (ATP)